MNSVLITGHRGFIGYHLVNAFHRLGGVKVIGFDLKDGVDIRARDRLPEADWCFHLAAMTDARSDNSEAMVNTNVNGTLHVLEQFGDRVVFASSSAINYPVTPYAISKLTGEWFCRLYGARTVRLCNIYGPGGHGVFQKFEKADILEVAGLGDQLRTYAPVEDALAALIAAPSNPVGSVDIVGGTDMTVTEIMTKHFGHKPWKRVPRESTDILDGRQLCP